MDAGGPIWTILMIAGIAWYFYFQGKQSRSRVKPANRRPERRL